MEESFEGTQAVKGAKAYILKEKFASFKMKEDESVPDMFHRMEVIVNDLKALGEKIEDKDFSNKFLRCLPARFGMLVTLLVRTGLNTMTPNQILEDIMIDDAYRDDDEKQKKREKKDEKKDEKKRTWHSKPHHLRAKQSKKHQVRIMIHGMMMMMRRWLYLSRDLASSW